MKNKKQKKTRFPISIVKLEENIQLLHSSYKVDYTKHTTMDIISSSDQLISLYCTVHKYFFSKEWKKLRTGIEYCIHCQCNSSNKKQIYLKYKVAEMFENHEIYPRLLIDDRFNMNERILVKEKLETKCLKCGHIDKEMSIDRFKAKDYVCTNCNNIKRLSSSDTIYNSVASINAIFQKVHISINELKEDNELLQYQCNICNFSEVVKRDFILRRKNKIAKNELNVEVCAKCKDKKNYIDIEKRALDKGFKLVDTFEKLFDTNKRLQLTDKFNFICKNGHKKTTSVNILIKDVCSDCKNYVKHSMNFQKLEKDLKSKGVIILEKSRPIKYREKILCECIHKHKFYSSLSKINKSNYCPTCSDKLGEKMTRIILSSIFGSNFIKKKPNFLKLSSGGILEYDAYNEKLEIAAEYNGLQHHEYREHFHKTKKEFLKQKDNDRKKAELSKKNGIKLIIINEQKNMPPSKENILDQIKEQCTKLNIDLPKLNEDIDVRAAYIGDNNKEEVLRIIKNNGGTVLSKQAINKKNQILIKCSDPSHKPFYKSLYQILQKNSWCPQCDFCQRVEEKLDDMFDGKREDIQLIKYETIGNSYNLDKANYTVKCSMGHIDTLKIRSIQRLLKNGEHWCKECRRLNSISKKKMSMWNKSISEVKRENKDISIDYDQSDYENGIIVFYNRLGLIDEYNLKKKNYKSNQPLNPQNKNKNGISISKKREYNKMIIEIYKNENAMHVKNLGKNHEWHCGNDGHPTFTQTASRLRKGKSQRGCKICDPHNSTKLTVQVLIYVANHINKKFDSNSSVKLISKELCNKNVKTNENYLFKCSNPEHPIYKKSYDNMTRRNKGCPICEKDSKQYLS